MGFFTRDIGMDLGTASVLVYIKGRGIVLREPSVVAVDEYSHTILAVGEGALAMLGRTPKGISAIRPLKNGVISDYELTERMIHYYLRQVLGRFNFTRPRLVVCVPAGVTEVERRSVVEASAEAGALEEEGEAPPPRQPITKGDLFALGLSGGPGSAGLRRALLRRLGLPEGIGPNALPGILTRVTTPEELGRLAEELRREAGEKEG